MKKKYLNKISISIIVITIIAFEACEKNVSSISNPAPPPVTMVTASVSGLITDLNNIPLSNATVTAGTSTTVTDVNGKFILGNVKLDPENGFVKVTKDGFFEGSRTFLVNANTVNNVKIQLIPKTVSGKFDAASGGDVNITGGGLVNFEASNVVNPSNGSTYTGNVYVSTFYLDPSAVNFSGYMPGALLGLNSSNQQKILQSFGMVSVEMDDASGGKLQIAGSKTATLTIPIPSALQANAPATIPLWYFDDTKGIWKQEGNANKQNNNYVGTVAHFSFWTAGQLGQNVRLDATFKDQNGKMLANNLVTITSTNYGTSNGYTDSSGTVSGLIPANEILELKVLDQCSNVMYTQNIGPFSTDANLGNITATVSAFNCIADNQFINLTLNGANYSWAPPDNLSGGIHTDTSGGYNSTLIQANSLNSIYFYILNDNASPGAYNISLNVVINSISYPNNNETTTVTEYGAVGGYISGAASGDLKELDSTTNIPFTMAYRVKRIQ